MLRNTKLTTHPIHDLAKERAERNGTQGDVSNCVLARKEFCQS